MEKRGFNIIINDTKYFIVAECVYEKNMNVSRENYFGLHIGFMVKNVNTGKWLTGSELKHTYLAEKIYDYVQNTINGQRRIYWDYDAKNENGDVEK